MTLRQLGSKDTIETACIGGFCPYWTLQNGRVLIADTAEEIILALPGQSRTVDPVAILGLLQFSYMLGDRTLVRGVQRMPWRATLRGDGTLQRRPPLPHGEREVEPQEASRFLRKLLSDELQEILQNRTRVFLLLSGGLDSRVIAGVLKTLESSSLEIICVTWGSAESRDVVYAQRVASWLGWEHVHLPYDAELSWANMQRGAVWGGSEVPGIHLHAMDWFRNARPDDLVIAASFGDSVGRAEFSSRHLSRLELAPLHNTSGLLRESGIRQWLALAERDRASAWEGETAEPYWVRCELDMQENYMRRMIGHAMNYIRQFCSLHQAFTSDKVVSYMWSLSPHCRTDAIYYCLLNDLDPRLAALPWARTGVAPDGTTERDSTLQREYHAVHHWLRDELRPLVEPLILSPHLAEWSPLYGPAIRRVWSYWLRELSDDSWSWGNVATLCSLELSRRHFGLLPAGPPASWRDATLNIARHCLGTTKTLLRRVRPFSFVVGACY